MDNSNSRINVPVEATLLRGWVKNAGGPIVARTVLVAALGIFSGMASADDSSMNPFTGDSYAYFNGGNLGSRSDNPVFDNTPSAWRKDNPSGWSERVFQAYSASGEALQLVPPVFVSESSEPAYKLTHPNGSTETELQALSSDAFGERFAAVARGLGIMASASHTEADAQRPSPAQRLATFLHLRRDDGTQ